MVLEKTLESPLDSKEIKQVNPFFSMTRYFLKVWYYKISNVGPHCLLKFLMCSSLLSTFARGTEFLNLRERKRILNFPVKATFSLPLIYAVENFLHPVAKEDS